MFVLSYFGIPSISFIDNPALYAIGFYIHPLCVIEWHIGMFFVCMTHLGPMTHKGLV